MSEPIAPKSTLSSAPAMGTNGDVTIRAEVDTTEPFTKEKNPDQEQELEDDGATVSRAGEESSAPATASSDVTAAQRARDFIYIFQLSRSAYALAHGVDTVGMLTFMKSDLFLSTGNMKHLRDMLEMLTDSIVSRMVNYRKLLDGKSIVTQDHYEKALNEIQHAWPEIVEKHDVTTLTLERIFQGLNISAQVVERRHAREFLVQCAKNIDYYLQGTGQAWNDAAAERVITRSLEAAHMVLSHGIPS